MLVAAALVVPVSATAEWITASLSTVRPLKYDQFVYCLDAYLYQPSFMLGRMVAASHGLTILVSVSYGLLPVMMLLVFGVYLWRRAEDLGLVVVVFVLNLFLAIPLYLIFPVCGPAFAFSSFPNDEQQIIPHLVEILAPPNGVPSVHTSSALLILWFLRKWKTGTLIGAVFLLLTALATLGSGQHYLFDLICAVPYAALIYMISVTLIRNAELTGLRRRATSSLKTSDAEHSGTRATRTVS